jgi:uncharacterized protein DUF6651
MKLKLNEQGFAIVQDDKPIYVADDGKEIPFDHAATLGTISRLNAEAKRHREEKEALAERLKSFDGIEDPAKALKALEVIKNLDDKKLIEAGEVDKVRAEAKTAYDEQLKSVVKKYEPVVAERDEFKNKLHNEILSGAFSRSKYIAEKLAVPVDMVQATFGKSFVIEADNKVVALDDKGERIFSRATPGEVASFDEALETLVESYSYRDSILKGSGASGGGANGSIRTIGGKKTITRTAFGELSPAEKMAAAKAGTEVVD